MKMKHFPIRQLNLSPIGLGTWRLGSYGEHPNESLKYGLESGINVIDTAESYAFGYAERLVGEAIKGYRREDLFIISKVLPNRLNIIYYALQSVKNLGTRMDLYLLHSPHIAEGTLKDRLIQMEQAIDMGLTRYIGVSNFTVKQIMEARSLLSKYDIIAVENKLNVFDKYWFDTVEYCQREGLAFFSYTSLDTGRVMNNNYVKRIGLRYGKTPIETALNWLIHIPNVVALCKIGHPEHLSGLLGALDWEMDKSDWQLLKDYDGVDGYSIFYWNLLKANIKYYLTPHLFRIYADYYKNPKKLYGYIKGTFWKRKHHL